MAGITRVIVDEPAVELFIRTEAGPAVARVAGPIVANAARASAPVYSGPSPRDHIPGMLRDSIQWRDTAEGGTEISAVFYDLFLELPARQIPTPIKTLEQALGDLPLVL